MNKIQSFSHVFKFSCFALPLTASQPLSERLEHNFFFPLASLVVFLRLNLDIFVKHKLLASN